MEKYLFIDRDGTIIEEPVIDKQVDSFEKLKFEPRVISSLKTLQNAGYKLVMVTNQDGLGTDSLPYENFKGPHQLMLDVLASEGVTFEEVLICPHFPHENCACRKPKTGLLGKYLVPGVVDKEHSFVIGDRETDMELAKNMGIGGERYNPETNSWTAIAERLTKIPRTAHVVRNTNETKIDLFVDLDHSGGSEISTGIGFFDHMLDQIATHGGITMKLKATGDLHVDEHHTVEDVGIALGSALRQALGDKRGIGRFGFAVAMDEVEAKLDGLPDDSLMNHPVDACMDISGRPYCVFSCDADFVRQQVGELSTEMVPHFFHSLAYAMGLTLHMKVTTGNTHHQVEALFKAFCRALRMALKKEGNELPSSKGVL
ncbi:bifunctional histidinol-phosphatase/imidazoleglycerol-phosphate dehydratase HisB [uncultured Ruminobacter sp.]|uniref:bifunctional histidinol-phosphatase/imidazoleglycerol-phosphate dehydratase HisB n=1 Tax=uncultured Ruminobacter sp. TaxID=538947 RepID=UPI0025FD8898|nr:bifunctional histidinol-phosphatase/imidazoleglycerol-phosphate dehydratase HisB [uncultured Ruminobacter sp.]